MRFEEQLRWLVGSVLVLGGVGTGCDDSEKLGGGGGTTTPPPSTDPLADTCAGAAPPEDYLLTTGFVVIEPGADCPETADAVLDVSACTFFEWQGITCTFDHVDRDQVHVDNGYGGYYANTTTAPTEGGYYEVSPDVVDVCYYTGVFYLPPDHPTCGRPLLHGGEAVVAEVRHGRSSWADEAHPVVAGLTAEERTAIGDHWLRSAVLEHASVASFSHFAMELIRFGAPPDLLHGAHQAALDEIVHAKLCFSLASGYRAAPVGPGLLGVSGLPAPAGSLGDMADALVREGCIGETLAAVDAAARLAVARDPAVRAALETIVRDESAHAALAWRTLAWVLTQDEDGAIRRRLARVFADERARWALVSDDREPVFPAARAHGLLPGAIRALTLERAWSEVIATSWAALA